MERRQIDRAQTDATPPGPGGSFTDTSLGNLASRPGISLIPERCESVELDHSIREHIKSHLLTQHAPVLDERQFKETQSRLSAAAGETVDSQIVFLEKQRKELLYINSKWAEQYQAMTQYYKDKITELKMPLISHGQVLEERSEDEEHESKINSVLPQTKENTNTQIDTQGPNRDISTKLQRAEREAERLRVQYTTLARRGHQQREEIRRLNEVLKGELKTTGLDEVTNGTQEEVWRHQAQVYKEDFLKERRDREKLKQKHTDLEKKFRNVWTELNTLKSQVG